MRQKLRASRLAIPLIAFIAITLILPIFSLIKLSFWDDTVRAVIPKTADLLADWHGPAPPNGEIFKQLAVELTIAQTERSIGKVASRVNRAMSGSRTVITKTPRRLARMEITDWRAAMIAVDERWGEAAIWFAIKQVSQPFTIRHYLQAVDLEIAADGTVQRVADSKAIYVTLFLRTLMVSAVVTALCLVIGYPMAYVMAHATPAWARVLLVLVLIPFWTSLLVRTTSWIVILQQQGVLNDLFVALHLINDEGRLTMVHNLTGTLIAMSQVLLPFMILPLYSVMISIPDNLTKAANSLGANPLQAFVRVYLPQSLPGVAAGGLLVFILSIGYYITPALVGGSKGQLISNMIAYHLQTSLNWSLAAALSVILLAGVFVLYVVYDRFVGLDRMKLG